MPQSRKWQLTINNPAEKGITHKVLKESLAKFAGMLYWCMCDEDVPCQRITVVCDASHVARLIESVDN